MKVYVEQELVCDLNLVQEKIMQYLINSSEFSSEIKRLVNYIVIHNYEWSLKILREHWEPILKKKGFQSIPTDDEEFATLVFSQPEYKDKKTRDDESKLLDSL